MDLVQVLKATSMILVRFLCLRILHNRSPVSSEGSRHAQMDHCFGEEGPQNRVAVQFRTVKLPQAGAYTYTPIERGS